MQVSSRLPAAARHGLRLLACGMMLGGLMACGYKGPLYLPPPEDPPATLTTPPSPVTTPAPSAPSSTDSR